MEEERKKSIKKYRKSRGGYKSAITILTKNLDEFLKRASPDEIRERKNAIESKLEKIERLNEALYEICNKDELAAEKAAVAKYFSDVQVMIARLERHEERNAQPNVTVPPFDGNPTNWVSFWDAFKRSVHENDNLTGAPKLAALKGLVTGEDKELIQRSEPESSNYDDAINLLKDKRSIRKVALVTEFCSLPSFGNAPQGESFHDSATRLLQGIEEENITREEMCAIILFNKIPSPLKKYVKRDFNDGVMDCQQLLERLHQNSRKHSGAFRET